MKSRWDHHKYEESGGTCGYGESSDGGCGMTKNDPIHMTPPPSEPTTGAERPTIAEALSAMLRAKVIRVDQVHHIRAILEPVWDATLAEVQRKTQEWRDIAAGHLKKVVYYANDLAAAEQREREAGAAGHDAAVAAWEAGWVACEAYHVDEPPEGRDAEEFKAEVMAQFLAAIRSNNDSRSNKEMTNRDINEFEELTLQPENMNVGQLNHIVRRLRERIHQNAITAEATREGLLYTSDKQTVAWKARALGSERREKELRQALEGMIAYVDDPHVQNALFIAGTHGATGTPESRQQNVLRVFNARQALTLRETGKHDHCIIRPGHPIDESCWGIEK